MDVVTILPRYVENLRQEDDKVIVVNSVNPANAVITPCHSACKLDGDVSFAFDQDVLESMLGDKTHDTREKLEEIASIMIYHKIKGTVKSIFATTPGKGIINMAKKVKADLIVMGSRRHNKLRRTIFGSVSDHVMHHSNIPVIVCRNKDSYHGRKIEPLI
ncbi:hypothetical protein KUTeg_020938 [Tegillarca granosa]|uniref:UspA domain-containing protein n=1 Tax=Tegillarca granosa TaxID=220873 RepID=A0ABQ9EC08_TEGGR|nr:hypothetical protein KUTeg_020938 [Tegillarca granosa]